MAIKATLYSDPACPWAYSALPALRVLEWRYGRGIDWRLVVIGLTEDASQYVARGYTPLRGALGQLRFKRYGMPFAPSRRSASAQPPAHAGAVPSQRGSTAGRRMAGVPRVAAGQLHDTTFARRRRSARGAPADHSRGRRRRGRVARLDDPLVTDAYERDRAEARTAAGSAAELQGKTAATGRARSLHRSVSRLRARRTATCCGWLPAGRGLRRAGGEYRAGNRTHTGSG